MTSVVHKPARLAEKGAKFEPGEQWRCDCGLEHRFGPYAVAHWDDGLDHECDCGAFHSFRSGRVIYSSN